MYNVDLSSVPADHLASLVSRASWSVAINNVHGCDLITFLDSVKSGGISIRNHRESLGSKETQALVRAMESHVEEVELDGDVTLDIKVLMEYNGQGKCRKLICNYIAATRYRDQLNTWARGRKLELDLILLGPVVENGNWT